MIRVRPAALLVLALTTSALAATPPPFINYQGVLRDTSDKVLDGTYDMVFVFWDASAGGNQLLADHHTIAYGIPVNVTKGMVNALLGGGFVIDGSGPGTYTSLADVFRDYFYVYLEIQVGPTGGARDTLTPRTRVVAAAYAQNATYFGGLPTSWFLDTSTGPQTKNATLTLRASGSYGVDAAGQTAGGHFWWNGDAGIKADLATSDGRGIAATGKSLAGEFQNASYSTWAKAGGQYYGLEARGAISYSSDAAGARFESPGGSEAFPAYSGTMGGEILYNWGIYARGPTGGAHFESTTTIASADLGTGGYGVTGYGTDAGGSFHDGEGSGRAFVGAGNIGINGYGSQAGASFWDDDNAAYAYVGSGTSKVTGNGAVSFVQNHPSDKDKVIVYTSPEGDEAAVYTRGSARLVDGEARVALGPTFQWVANPDLGLTAHLTPRGAPADLYVAALSTGELVVRGASGARDAAFDYIVYGLRIGFEDVAVVRPKTVESFIPSMAEHRALYARFPELRAYSARERFGAAGALVSGPAADGARARALREAIHEYDAATDPPLGSLLGMAEAGRATTIAARAGAVPAPAAAGSAAGVAGTAAASATGAAAAAPGAALAPAGTVVAVLEPVDAGEVLTLDPVTPGQFRRAVGAADPLVAGVAAGAAVPQDGRWQVALVDARYARVKADAAAAPIRPGDLVVSSALPGHAMRAPAGAPAGAVIGKALEGLDAGTGTILVLLLSH